MIAKKRKIKLGVNLDHVATLRQVRGGTTSYPNLLEQMKAAIDGGAQQITVHLREDRRHIQDKDVILLLKACRLAHISLNLEIAATSKMLQFALSQKPDCVCFVPEKRKELTTEGGLDIHAFLHKLYRYISQLKTKNIFTSLFIEPSIKQVQAAAFCKADAIEFHTGRFVNLKRQKQQDREWKRLVVAAKKAHSLNLKVHAGHGLDNITSKKICRLPYLEEVNIGHFLVCEALNVGMKKSVNAIKKVIRHVEDKRS